MEENNKSFLANIWSVYVEDLFGLNKILEKFDLV